MEASPGTVGWSRFRRMTGTIQDGKSLDWPGEVRLWKRRLRENDGCPSGVFPTHGGCSALVKVSLLRCRFPMGHRPHREAPFGGEVSPFSSHVSCSTSIHPRGWHGGRLASERLGPGACRAAGGSHRTGRSRLPLLQASTWLPPTRGTAAAPASSALLFTPNSLHKNGRWAVTGWGSEWWRGTAMASAVLFTG